MDSDGGGYGNRCDTDLNNDGVVGNTDPALFAQTYNTRAVGGRPNGRQYNPMMDFNNDQAVNPLDLCIFKAWFFSSEGPGSGAIDRADDPRLAYIHFEHRGAPIAVSDEAGVMMITMNSKLNIVIVAVLLMPNTLKAESCSSSLIDWSSYEETLQSLKITYHSDQFEVLDNALDCLLKNNNKQIFNTGKTGAATVYWFFRKEMPAPGANSQDEVRISKWKDAMPNSPYHHFAKLRILYSKAWNYRGTKYANKTSKVQFSRFNDQLILTEDAILSDKNRFKETAIYYNLLLAVALDAQGAKTSPVDTFHDGVKKWPNYYDFHELILTRLVPKWGGSWEKADGFINNWSKKLSGVEGKSLYARLYYSVHSLNKINPHITRVAWDIQKSSLDTLMKEYSAKEHYEIAASYACYFRDHDFYSHVVATHNVATSKYWLVHTTREECDSFFEAMPNR